MTDFQLDRMCGEYQQGMNDLTLEQRLYDHFSFTPKNADSLIALYRNGLTQLVYDQFCTLRPDVTPVWSEDPVEQEYRCRSGSDSARMDQQRMQGKHR